MTEEKGKRVTWIAIWRRKHRFWDSESIERNGFKGCAILWPVYVFFHSAANYRHLAPVIKRRKKHFLWRVLSDRYTFWTIVFVFLIVFLTVEKLKKKKVSKYRGKFTWWPFLWFTVLFFVFVIQVKIIEESSYFHKIFILAFSRLGQIVKTKTLSWLYGQLKF